ncbi:MAG: diphosphate--fructose-6-phosphate 1-phosphotransferase [Candidatus Sumerlaeota bacterium]|nr:diphosphate--fructose-6-phosphate 1-phosphotransferase [Candidatus Sumerlaeota bacterium]
MSDCTISPLQKARLSYAPKMPGILRGGKCAVSQGKVIMPPGNSIKIKEMFPKTYGKPLVTLCEGGGGSLGSSPLTVGVVLSGGPAPGGHNAIAGLFDALKAANPASRLVGFLNGPKGVMMNKSREITKELAAQYRNTGGFDMIGSGRDKIETAEELAACAKTAVETGLNALVIVGGDDSNTNAAILAEYCEAIKIAMRVIGLPKTIDGDMRNEYIEASFGFDTATRTYAKLVGNVCRDAMSSRKYYHFIKLMGRSASHVALEVALQTQPNMAIISEELQARKQTFSDVVDQIVDVICRRAASGKNYGVIVIPEGLLEFLDDFKSFLKELGLKLGEEESSLAALANEKERREHLHSKLSKDSAKVYRSLPVGVQEVLLRRDPHGNVVVSQIESEKAIIEYVTEKIEALAKEGKFKGKFAALGHFFGYEGRCGFPSNFDADYTYCLGYAGVQLIRAGLTGYTVSALNLAGPAEEWIFGGVPITSMLTLENRKGQWKPVIKKHLADLEGGPFKRFAAERDKWAIGDVYKFPGDIQFFGPSELTDARTLTLQLEAAAKKR